MKQCSRCKEVKPLEDFHRSRGFADGRQYMCKACKSQAQKGAYARNRERRIASVRKHYYANHEKMKAKARERYAREPEKNKRLVWERHIRVNYNLTPEGWQALLDGQDGRCKICGAAEHGGRGWHTDHCHATKIVRGILCSGCNQGLGFFADSPERLEAAAAYLRHYQTQTSTGNESRTEPTETGN